MTIQLFSEPRRATGDMSGSGVLQTLGRPDLDFWALLARETIQNSWDAADSNRSGPVRYTAELRHLAPSEHRALVSRVLPGRPDDGARKWATLDDPGLPVLIISDRGTTGLGGPIRADEYADEPTDFSDFVWNIGQPPDKALGGGTYGYGRTVLYRASGANAIVAYSRAAGSDGLESRLIGIGLGEPFRTERRVLNTGRHWWAEVEAGIPAPVRGPKADELAESLGLQRFARSETGSTFVVPACDIEETAETTMRRLAEAALWHCWPKMADLGDGPDMEFRFEADGVEIPTDDPASHPEIGHLVECLRVIHGQEPGLVTLSPIEAKSPPRMLGQLALRRFQGPSEPDDDLDVRPFKGPMRHVALMRAPKLVVKYLPGRESSVPNTVWGGVFAADDDVDREFADAEPPDHADWIVQSSTSSKRPRSLVRIALRRIKELADDFNAVAPYVGEAQATPLGAVADTLGHLLRTDVGGGSGVREKPRRPRKSGLSVPRVIAGAPALHLVDGRRAIRVPFRVEAPAGVNSVAVSAVARVVINDGASTESDPPEGAPQPEILHFVAPNQKELGGDEVVVSAGTEGEWAVLVSAPEDTSVAVSFSASPSKAAE